MDAALDRVAVRPPRIATIRKRAVDRFQGTADDPSPVAVQLLKMIAAQDHVAVQSQETAEGQSLVAVQLHWKINI